MSQLWSTGPAYIFVAPSPGVYTKGGTPLFVGTARTKPIIDIDDEFTPIRNDIGGSVPIDKLYDGQSGMVTVDFNRFNYGTIQQLCRVPNAASALGFNANPAGQAPVSGFDTAGNVGTLMVTESQVVALVVMFPYALKPAYSTALTGGMVPGYRFWGAMVNKESIHAGTDEHQKRLIFDCQRVPATGRTAAGNAANIYGSTGFVLYDIPAQSFWNTLLALAV